MGVDDKKLRAFVRESNAIEGITRRPTDVELAAHRVFLGAEAPGVTDLEAFVLAVAGARLRDRAGMNVVVGDHRPPPGGPEIRTDLAALLGVARDEEADPYAVHVAYETLHPFMDGNGRSGRALWLWMMVGRGYRGQLGFLHAWYYQSLSGGRR